MRRRPPAKGSTKTRERPPGNCRNAGCAPRAKRWPATPRPILLQWFCRWNPPTPPPDGTSCFWLPLPKSVGFPGCWKRGAGAFLPEPRRAFGAPRPPDNRFQRPAAGADARRRWGFPGPQTGRRPPGSAAASQRKVGEAFADPSRPSYPPSSLARKALKTPRETASYRSDSPKKTWGPPSSLRWE